MAYTVRPTFGSRIRDLNTVVAKQSIKTTHAVYRIGVLGGNLRIGHDELSDNATFYCRQMAGTIGNTNLIVKKRWELFNY